MSTLTTLISLAGVAMNASMAQIKLIADLTYASTKGGMAVIQGYKPTSSWIVSPVQTITMITKFSTAKLYARRIAAIEAVNFAGVKTGVAGNDKLAGLTTEKAEALFNTRKAMELASLQKTLDGDRSDAHRQGHDRCYHTIAQGIKVHFVTDKGHDGKMHPVLDNGTPTIASIMVNGLFINVNTDVEGTRKVVNNGPAVLMTQLIQRAINKTSLQFKAVSLKDDNFTKLSIDKERIYPAKYLEVQ